MYVWSSDITNWRVKFHNRIPMYFNQIYVCMNLTTTLFLIHLKMLKLIWKYFKQRKMMKQNKYTYIDLRNKYIFFLVDRGINQERTENRINAPSAICCKSVLFFFGLIPRLTEKILSFNFHCISTKKTIISKSCVQRL